MSVRVYVVWGRQGVGVKAGKHVRSLLWRLRSSRRVRVFIFSLVVHPVVSRRSLFCLVLFFLLRIEQVEF